MKLSGICLETNDVPGLVDFYARILCASAEGDAVHSAFVEAGLAILNPGFLSQLKEQSAPGSSDKSFTMMFEVDDVDAEYERLKKYNIEFTLLPTPQPWGARALWFNDPEGHKIDFYSVKNPLAPELRGNQ